MKDTEKEQSEGGGGGFQRDWDSDGHRVASSEYLLID